MGRRHISTSGLAASALWTMVFAVFRPVRPPFACDASSIGPGTKLCSRYTTSGLVKPEVRFLAAISAPKTVFCLGGIDPHLGETWGFEFWSILRILAYFCSKLCQQIFDFLTAFDSHVSALTMLKIS